MKLTIRKNVFETNSSSTHSLVISTETNVKYNLPKELFFGVGEFGWEYAIYSDAVSKASYLYMLMYHFEDIEYTNSDTFKIKPFINVIKWLKQEKVKVVFQDITKDDYGYVDHAGEAWEFYEYVLSSKENLMNYLFNPNSFIITYNDNNWEDDNYVEDSAKAMCDHYPHMYFYKGN